MRNNTTHEMARYIFTTGKLIHDRIIKIQGQCLASFEKSPFQELSMSQLNVMRVVRESGELSMSELAEQMAVSPPSASAMVDRLVEKGVLCREHCTQDRRKVVVRISPEAVKKVEEIEQRIMQLFVDLVGKIGSETAQKWCDVLSRVKSALPEEAASRQTVLSDKSSAQKFN
jgi:DNA-binding MarR family transcriptional regulator